MTQSVKVNAKFEGKGKIGRSGGKWVVHRSGTVNGHHSVKTTVCDNLFAAIREIYARR